MNDRLAFWRGAFYEGNSHSVYLIRPLPVISAVTCGFITKAGLEIIFREDNFDPVTRIRRGRIYVGGNGIHQWDQVTIDGQRSYNWGNLLPTASYNPWQPEVSSHHIVGQIIQIGSNEFETNWQIVGVEKLTIGHFMLTLRAKSLVGVIPDIPAALTDNDGNRVDTLPIKNALDSLVDIYHRQQPTPTIDAARETARVILASYIGHDAQRKDLKDVINAVPQQYTVVRSAATIVNRMHPRGKSAEQEAQASRGFMLRPITADDAEASIHLVGLLIREIGWSDS
ncbi:MAG: hypothetical protein PHG39_12340 [Acidithiobacillus ferrooxidans]|nr:hypothetical protein [Acidithiobacillus ferrooxidans]MDD5003943.1 hypothetical protein [Acidithiobacillus sp.]MDD5379771.1 hypothetical protein [Acidithiobacillus sp.]MDD5577099.1 hypothetical protein [Acidithiobacillus sp.]